MVIDKGFTGLRVVSVEFSGHAPPFRVEVLVSCVAAGILTVLRSQRIQRRIVFPRIYLGEPGILVGSRADFPVTHQSAGLAPNVISQGVLVTSEILTKQSPKFPVMPVKLDRILLFDITCQRYGNGTRVAGFWVEGPWMGRHLSKAIKLRTLIFWNTEAEETLLHTDPDHQGYDQFIDHMRSQNYRPSVVIKLWILLCELCSHKRFSLNGQPLFSAIS